MKRSVFQERKEGELISLAKDLYKQGFTTRQVAKRLPTEKSHTWVWDKVKDLKESSTEG